MAEPDPDRTRPEFTSAELEQMFHGFLKDGDAKGVEAALTVMTRVDPDRAIYLYELLKKAFTVLEFLGLHEPIERGGTDG